MSFKGKIFLTYRKSDEPGAAIALFDVLEQEFEPERLIMDGEGPLRDSDEFLAVLKQDIMECDVLIVLIGPRWLAVADRDGRRRLDAKNDWMRVLIVMALQMRKRIIPVLFGSAEMPRAEDLPGPLKPFARKQAYRVSIENFNADAKGLTSRIRNVLEDITTARIAAEEVEKLRKEENEREAKRAQQEDEIAWGERAASLNAEEVRRLEELMNWQFIEKRANVDEIRNHLARFPGGVTERYALAILEKIAWEEHARIAELERQAEQARHAAAEAAYQTAKNAETTDALRDFIAVWSGTGDWHARATEDISQLQMRFLPNWSLIAVFCASLLFTIILSSILANIYSAILPRILFLHLLSIALSLGATIILFLYLDNPIEYKISNATSFEARKMYLIFKMLALYCAACLFWFSVFCLIASFLSLIPSEVVTFFRTLVKTIDSALRGMRLSSNLIIWGFGMLVSGIGFLLQFILGLFFLGFIGFLIGVAADNSIRFLGEVRKRL